MSENRLYEKLDLIAKRTEGIFVSSSLVSSKDESSSWVKFQQKYPDMFIVVFTDKAKIYQARQSFFRFFYSDTIPKKFETKKDILTEILHSSFVLDIGQHSSRVGLKVYLEKDIFTLDDFSSKEGNTKIITVDERKRAFSSITTSVYVPRNLQSKWSKLCLQRYFSSEAVVNEIKHAEITPEFARAFITDEVFTETVTLEKATAYD
jgi:hypothetical protein